MCVCVCVCVPSSIYHLFRRPKRLVENDILMSTTVYRRIIVAVFGDTVTRVVGTGCYSTYLISR